MSTTTPLRAVRRSAQLAFATFALALCTGWSFESETQEPATTGEPVLAAEPTLNAKQGIDFPTSEEVLESIELDPSPVLPEVLPSAVSDLPDILGDPAL